MASKAQREQTEAAAARKGSAAFRAQQALHAEADRQVRALSARPGGLSSVQVGGWCACVYSTKVKAMPGSVVLNLSRCEYCTAAQCVVQSITLFTEWR